MIAQVAHEIGLRRGVIERVEIPAFGAIGGAYDLGFGEQAELFAVNDEGAAVDVPGCVGAKPHGEPRGLFRCRDRLARHDPHITDAGKAEILLRFADGLDHVRNRDARVGARADRIAADVVGTEIARDRAREADDPFLGGRVVRHAVMAEPGMR